MCPRTNALRLRGASSYESKRPRLHINYLSSLQRLKLKLRLMLINILSLMCRLIFVLKFVIFLRFFKGALLPNFNKVIEHELQFMGVGQLEDIFSMALKKLCAWINL